MCVFTKNNIENSVPNRFTYETKFSLRQNVHCITIDDPSARMSNNSSVSAVRTISHRHRCTSGVFFARWTPSRPCKRIAEDCCVTVALTVHGLHPITAIVSLIHQQVGAAASAVHETSRIPPKFRSCASPPWPVSIVLIAW